MPDTVFIENKFAKRAMAEFALQFPSLIQREAGALDEYRRWKREREERLAMEEAEEEEDIRAEPARALRVEERGLRTCLRACLRACPRAERWEK